MHHKDKRSLSSRLRSLTPEFGENVFPADNKTLVRRLCEFKVVDREIRSGVMQHAETENIAVLY